MNILSKSKIFLYSSIFFILGIFLASFSNLEIIKHDIWWFGGMILCLVLIIIFYKHKRVFLISLFGLFLFLGIWRYSVSIPVNSPDKIWYYNEDVISAIGFVVEEPDVRQYNQKLKIKTKYDGKILVTTNLYPSYNYGDEVKISCEFKTPEEFSGFAYDRYLARYDIYSVCYYPKIELISSNNGSWFYEKIYLFKNKIREQINYNLNEPEASLAKAIIIGDKKGMTDDLRSKFSQIGLSHIVAISGMHISILSALVMAGLLGLGVSRKRSFYGATAFLIIYIILIGMPASAMRAGIMGFLVLLAMNLGRLNKLTNSLALAGLVLLLINPRLLRDDIGFQLSFLAVLGIAYFYPLLNKYLDKFKIPKLKGIRDILNITISAQVFTLPILAFNFNQISLIAPISNLLVLWILPVLMIAIILALVLSFVFPSLGVVFFLPVAVLIKYIIFIADFLSKVPLAFIEVDYIWWGWGVVYYVIIVWLVRIVNDKKVNRE